MALFRVYNSVGEHIRNIDLPASPLVGPVTLTWDGTNQGGEKCASGIYLLRFTSSLNLGVKKVVLIR
jgi:flagellar hook assembly protein FlgD